jgi:hypothetical protein
MIYSKVLTLEKAGDHKIIELIPDKKITVLSYDLYCNEEQTAKFKTINSSLTEDLIINGNKSDSNTTGITEILGLFHSELNEDIFINLSNSKKTELNILYSDEFNY